MNLPAARNTNVFAQKTAHMKSNPQMMNLIMVKFL